jgi:hypothetical protein
MTDKLEASHTSWQIFNDKGEQTVHGESRGNDQVIISTEGGGSEPFGLVALNTLERLETSARQELRAAGAETDHDVIEAVLRARPIDTDQDKAAHAALTDWFLGVQRQLGFNKRLVRAARFLLEYRLCCIKLSQSQFTFKPGTAVSAGMEEIVKERVRTACHFAHAWHGWHRELFEEHDLEYEGRMMIDGREAGRSKISNESRRRWEIVARMLGEEVYDEEVGQKTVAGHIMVRRQEINELFANEDLDPLAENEGALIKMVERMRKHHRTGGFGTR